PRRLARPARASAPHRGLLPRRARRSARRPPHAVERRSPEILRDAARPRHEPGPPRVRLHARRVPDADEPLPPPPHAPGDPARSPPVAQRRARILELPPEPPALRPLGGPARPLARPAGDGRALPEERAEGPGDRPRLRSVGGPRLRRRSGPA